MSIYIVYNKYKVKELDVEIRNNTISSVIEDERSSSFFLRKNNSKKT